MIGCWGKKDGACKRVDLRLDKGDVNIDESLAVDERLQFGGTVMSDIPSQGVRGDDDPDSRVRGVDASLPFVVKGIPAKAD